MPEKYVNVALVFSPWSKLCSPPILPVQHQLHCLQKREAIQNKSPTTSEASIKYVGKSDLKIRFIWFCCEVSSSQSVNLPGHSHFSIRTPNTFHFKFIAVGSVSSLIWRVAIG